jgi:hypothetical protein
MPSSKQLPAHRPISRLAVRLLLFSLPILLVCAALEFRARQVPNSYSVKRRQVELLANDIDTLIIGSSSGYYGIVPKHLSGFAYNLADAGETLYYDDALATKVVPKLPRLKRVLVQIQYISLYITVEDGPEPWRMYYYQQEWGIPPVKLGDRLDARMFSRVALNGAASLGKALGGLVRREPYVPDPIDDRGWWGPANEEIDPEAINPAGAKATLDRHHLYMKAALEPENLVYLEHIASLLRGRNIELVFVTMPVWHTYSDGMNKETWAHTQTVVEGLCKKYNARYLNFLVCPQLQAGDFKDADHLNPQGAVKFTELLDAALAHSEGK